MRTSLEPPIECCLFLRNRSSTGNGENVSLPLWMSSAFVRRRECMTLGGTCLRGSGFRWTGVQNSVQRNGKKREPCLTKRQEEFGQMQNKVQEPNSQKNMSVKHTDRAICFKFDCEGIFVIFTVTLTFEIKIKGEREAGNFERGHEKEKIRVAIESGKRDPGGDSLLSSDGGQSSQDQWKTATFPWKVEGSFITKFLS